MLIIRQAPYNRVNYFIIGDDAAPNFFSVDQETGRVTIRRSLNEDSASVYKVSCIDVEIEHIIVVVIMVR